MSPREQVTVEDDDDGWDWTGWSGWMSRKTLVMKTDELLFVKYTVLLKRSIWQEKKKSQLAVRNLTQMILHTDKTKNTKYMFIALTKSLLTLIGSLNTVQMTASLQFGVVREPRYR